MFNRIAYFFISASLLIIQGHDIVTHHHDLPHAHENTSNHDNEAHNVFSLIDVDDEFTSQNKCEINNNFISEIVFNAIEIKAVESTLKSLFVLKREYPPPKPTVSFKSLKAPPVNFFC